MATPVKNAQQLASMSAKEERARDGARAMKEYEAERLAITAKTARLRALRLAKELEVKQHKKPIAPRTKARGRKAA